MEDVHCTTHVSGRVLAGCFGTYVSHNLGVLEKWMAILHPWVSFVLFSSHTHRNLLWLSYRPHFFGFQIKMREDVLVMFYFGVCGWIFACHDMIWLDCDNSQWTSLLLWRKQGYGTPRFLEINDSDYSFNLKSLYNCHWMSGWLSEIGTNDGLINSHCDGYLSGSLCASQNKVS